MSAGIVLCATCHQGARESKDILHTRWCATRRRLDAQRLAPSPPPQPATTRLAAEADDLEQRYTAQRERAERAEEEARALRLEVRALKEARGELLGLVDGREDRFDDLCEFGWHHSDCPAYGWVNGGGYPCPCGFDEALEAARP